MLFLGQWKLVQDLHWLRSLKNNLRSEDVMGMWPSSSSSLYIWNQGPILTWYIGNWEPKVPNIFGNWKMRVHRCDTCLLMLDVDFLSVFVAGISCDCLFWVFLLACSHDVRRAKSWYFRCLVGIVLYGLVMGMGPWRMGIHGIEILTAKNGKSTKTRII